MIKVQPLTLVYEWCWNATLTLSSLGSWENSQATRTCAKFNRDKRKITRWKLPSQSRRGSSQWGAPISVVNASKRHLHRSRQFHVTTARSMASETSRLVKKHSGWHRSPYDIATPVNNHEKHHYRQLKNFYFAANFCRRTRPVMRWGKLYKF